MERTVLLVLLVLLCARAKSGKIRRYDFVNNQKNWIDAQSVCREHFTDLAFINNATDQEDILRAGRNSHRGVWIGLHREADMVWKWSGRGNVTYINWDLGQPDNFGGEEDRGVLKESRKWGDRPGYKTLPFYCYSLPVVVEEAKPWEEALEHCRRRGSDLMSPGYYTAFSRSDLQEQLEKIQTQRMWMGLRFLGDRWVWVDGQRWKPQSWSGGDEEHQCPVSERCGALTTEDLWENLDCQERLPFICD